MYTGKDLSPQVNITQSVFLRGHILSPVLRKSFPVIVPHHKSHSGRLYQDQIRIRENELERTEILWAESRKSSFQYEWLTQPANELRAWS
jgi:hypothetical protein